VYNDYEDAPYDKEDDQKRNRNVFCGEDEGKKRIGKIIIIATPVLSVLLGLFVSPEWAIFAFALVVLGFLYSSPLFRAKERPFWDWAFHVVWLAMIVVPGYLYFFQPDELLFAMWTILAVNSLIAQINNEMADFQVDSLVGHRTTTIILGRKRTFYIRSALEFLLVGLVFWLTIQYKFYVVSIVMIPTFLCFLWVERIAAWNKLDSIRDHVQFEKGVRRRTRLTYFTFLWGFVAISEAVFKRLL
jgi:4-hydroxybenzoate polyprenyltransferase